MIINIKKRTKGFGILEVLLSGVIIIIILGALVFVARNAINNSAYVQERAQAANLAQEGMEVVRQIRDSNYIDKNVANPTAWNTMVGTGPTGTGPSAPFAYDTDYIIEYNSLGRFDLIQGSSLIKIDGINFDRKIRFTSINDSPILTSPTDVNNEGKNGAIVKVTVTWPESANHKVEIEELLTNNRFQY